MNLRSVRASTFENERRFKLFMGDLLYNNDPERNVEYTLDDLKDLLESNYENLLEIVDIVEEEITEFDLENFKKENDIDG